MSISVSILKDVEGIDETPFWNFCQWSREYDHEQYFMSYTYSWPESSSEIIDLGDLSDNLDNYFENPHGLADNELPQFEQEPPDIRKWLQEQIDAGHTLAWVSW